MMKRVQEEEEDQKYVGVTVKSDLQKAKEDRVIWRTAVADRK